MDHGIDKDEHGEQDMSETIPSLAEIERSIEDKLPLPPVNKVMASLNKNWILLRKNVKRQRSEFENSCDIICQDIFSAIGCGDLTTLKTFIFMFGSDKVLNLKLKNEYSVIHCAAFRGQWEICNYLIWDHRVDVNMKDIQDNTPLFYAALGGNTKIRKSDDKYESASMIEGLEDLSRSVTARDQMKTIDVLIDHKADVNAFNLGEQSALHFAASSGNIYAIESLLKHDCTALHIRTTDFGTPLRPAAYHNREKALDCLLDHRADPNLVPDGCLSPLLIAVRRDHKECAIRLILRGADTNYEAHGMAPLEVAISRGSMEIFECLLENGAMTHRKDIYGLFPLELAALKNNRGMVEKLFPLTEPINGIEDWSVTGVMDHCLSNEFETEMKQKENDALSYFLLEGDKAFDARKYVSAITWYAMAKSINNDRVFFLAKRSLCYSGMMELTRAFADACECTNLNVNYSLGWYAYGVFNNLRKDFGSASTCFEMACRWEQDNKMYEDALRDALKNLIRRFQETHPCEV